MNRKKPTVLLAESGEGSTGRIEELLEDRDIEVLKCVDGIEAIRTSFREKPDLIISDVTLPRLNGYQLARILKSDPLMNSTPIVLIGSLENPIERYWSRVCGGYDYLPKPVRQIDLDESLHKFLRIGGSKRQMMTSVSTIPDLEDYAILSLATNLLEHELLRATILNEINMIDISAMSAEDLVMALMTIVNCLHDFDLGAVLLINDRSGRFFFYPNGQVEQSHLDEIKKLVYKHLERRHEIYLDAGNVVQNLLPTTQHKEISSKLDEVYIHTKKSGTVRSVFAFENIRLEKLKEDEQEILDFSLHVVHGVLEKKIFFERSQEFSIIDLATEGYSMAFFMACLQREIENAVRNGYPITLTTLSVSNFRDITKGLSANEAHGLIPIIVGLILKATRKADLVVRWGTASFAFLSTQTGLENARVAQERIIKYIMQNITRHLPPNAKLVVDKGIAQFDQELDKTPEDFLARAQPKKGPETE